MEVGLGWAVNLRRVVSQFSSFVSWVTSCRDFACSLAEFPPPGSKGLQSLKEHRKRCNTI